MWLWDEHADLEPGMTNVPGAGSQPLRILRDLPEACDASPTTDPSCQDWVAATHYTGPAAPSAVPSDKRTWFIMSCKRTEKLSTKHSYFPLPHTHVTYIRSWNFCTVNCFPDIMYLVLSGVNKQQILVQFPGHICCHTHVRLRESMDIGTAAGDS
jgi:hypothetical protein